MPDDTSIPHWTDTPPLPGSRRSIAKMGRQDQVEVPTARYFRQLQKDLQLQAGDLANRQDGNEPLGDVPASGLNLELVETLAGIVGAENIQLDDYNRVKYSYGKLAGEIVSLKRGALHEITGAVVHPRHKQDVQALVSLCDLRRIPLYVYGGGSSVNQGFLPERQGITLVMSTHMNRVLEVNDLNHTCRVEAGCMGPQLEHALNQAPELFAARNRFTCGHFPQSFEISSVGGWVLTLGSGQASTYYGEPASLVLGMEMVTPRGTLKTGDYPVTATGPRVTDILKGSEGVFGVLVELSLKVYRFFPENRKYFGYIFPGWSQAVDAAREICQAQFGLPAVLRISDAAETDNAFQLYPQPAPLEWALTGLGFKPGRRCLCMGTVEGERGFTALVRRKIASVVRRNGGFSITGSPARKWETDRYTNYLFSEAVSDYDIIMDTVETPVLWDNLHHIHDTVLAYARSVPGTTCMSHMSHFYPQGTNLYFIFGVKGSLERYIDYRTGLVDAMVRAGGSPSHHHGVGRLMTPWIGSFLGKPEMDVLRALKGHFDPHGVMNPGSQLGLLPPDDQPV